ncbi:MAG TPA: hypothetical protein PLF13_05625 [candidate division Zixibacteria bacterium]|nr:hypothetical protein [candidate division Zixibacteria bacterium]
MRLKEAVTLTVLALLAVTGCIPLSINPLYQDGEVISIEGIEGLWVIEGTSDWIRFQVDTLDPGYILTMSEDDESTSVFEARPVRVGDMLMIDLFPAEPTEETLGEFYQGHLVPVHSFYRIDEVGTRLGISTLEYDWLTSILTDHPDEIAHIWAEEVPILTASTKEIQAFLLKYAVDHDAWTEVAEYVRK